MDKSKCMRERVEERRESFGASGNNPGWRCDRTFRTWLGRDRLSLNRRGGRLRWQFDLRFGIQHRQPTFASLLASCCPLTMRDLVLFDDNGLAIRCLFFTFPSLWRCGEMKSYAYSSWVRVFFFFLHILPGFWILSFDSPKYMLLFSLDCLFSSA